MVSALVHRGPDAEGVWIDKKKGVHLGHRRLSIIDLTDGAQPMRTQDDSLIVVFNGEIYNHLELRVELEKAGHVFHTDHCDTEVLLHGFREWGEDLQNRMNGMWAFALYDKTKGTLFLSRDRFGKKPLFYSMQNGTFAFASELTALIRHPGILAKVSARSLKKYFAYGYIPAPNSLYERIHKLPGGECLKFRIPELDYRTRKYWDFVLDPFETVSTNAEAEYCEEIRHLLSAAVKRRLMSDVPLGVFLSGGMDSSSVSYYAKEHAGSVKTFSIGFGEKSFDESDYAARAADFLGAEHRLDRLPLDLAQRLVPEISARLDEPMGDSSLLPTFLLCRETRKRVTVALGGDGADELFAGYDPFQALWLAKQYDRVVPKPLHRAVSLVCTMLPTNHRNMSLSFRVNRVLRGLSYAPNLWNPIWLGPLDPIEISELFRETIDIEDVYSEAIEQWDSCAQDSLIDKTLQFYTKLYLQDDILVKVDRAGMMNSLEVRSPYLDIDLVDFVRRIPSRFKLRRGTTKYILKRALEPVLPRDILYRSKKGFGVPIGKWIKERRIEVDIQDAGSLLSRLECERRLKMHQRGVDDNGSFLWNLMIAAPHFSRSNSDLH